MAAEIFYKIGCCRKLITIRMLGCFLQPKNTRYSSCTFCQVCNVYYHSEVKTKLNKMPRQQKLAGLSETDVVKKSTMLKAVNKPYSQYAKVMRDIQLRRYSTSITDNSDTFNTFCDSLIEEHKALSALKAKIEALKKEDDLRLKYLSGRINVLLEIKAKQKEYTDLMEMKKEYEVSKDMKKMVEEEIKEWQDQMLDLRSQLQDLVLPVEKADHINDVVLEVNSAVGGQESMQFTAEIFSMYEKYASYKGWDFELEIERADGGGIRTASASIRGENVYRCLKFEAGVHRVQRVPKTEKAGRIHTSTMTVSVMPQPTEVDIEINPKDLRIDTFRSSGAGGQSVNKTDSAVRIVHVPTGLRAECQQERSQITNKSIAMKRLRASLYQIEIDEQASKRRSQRKLQVGSAGRSEKIRTYNYSQDRITDHRIHCTFFGVSSFLCGTEALDEFIEKLQVESKKEIFEEMLQEFADSQKQKHSRNDVNVKKDSR